MATAALALAACGGSSTPGVASLGSNSGNNGADTPTSSGHNDASGAGSAATTLPNGNPTRLLNEWAACMRSHGDPNQADPIVDANRDIDINWDPAIPGGYDGTDKGGQGDLGPGQYCRAYLTEAQTDLGGNQQGSRSTNQATLEKLATCMRANGIPDFPDPIDGNLSFNVGGGGDLNPNNPTFHHAAELCARRTGAHLPGVGGPPPGTIKLDGGGPLPNG